MVLHFGGGHENFWESLDPFPKKGHTAHRRCCLPSQKGHRYHLKPTHEVRMPGTLLCLLLSWLSLGNSAGHKHWMPFVQPCHLSCHAGLLLIHLKSPPLGNFPGLISLQCNYYLIADTQPINSPWWMTLNISPFCPMAGLNDIIICLFLQMLFPFPHLPFFLEEDAVGKLWLKYWNEKDW